MEVRLVEVLQLMVAKATAARRRLELTPSDVTYLAGTSRALRFVIRFLAPFSAASLASFPSSSSHCVCRAWAREAMKFLWPQWIQRGVKLERLRGAIRYGCALRFHLKMLDPSARDTTFVYVDMEDRISYSEVLEALVTHDMQGFTAPVEFFVGVKRNKAFEAASRARASLRGRQGRVSPRARRTARAHRGAGRGFL